MTGETKKQIKQIKDELKNLGFKISRHPFYERAWVYNEQKIFCLVINFLDNKYCSAQMKIDMPEELDTYFNFDDEVSFLLNFELEKLNKVVPTAKKAIKIVDKLNKNINQLNTDIKQFGSLA
jgi:hypothetical protein